MAAFCIHCACKSTEPRLPNINRKIDSLKTARKVGYLLKTYPRFSQTFILNEILSELGLRTKGDINYFDKLSKAIVTNYVSTNVDCRDQLVRLYHYLSITRHIFISTKMPARRVFTNELVNYLQSWSSHEHW